MAHSLPSIAATQDSLVCGLGPNIEPVRCHLPPQMPLSPGRLSPDNPGGKPVCSEQVDSGEVLGEGEPCSTTVLGSSGGNRVNIFLPAAALPNLKYPRTLLAEIIPPHVPDASCTPLSSPPPLSSTPSLRRHCLP